MQKLLSCGALLFFCALASSLAATSATSLSDFGGIEEPEVIYHVSTGSFTNDSFINITDQGGGVFRMFLRYHANDWWDGDRTATSTDRQRAEVKVLGPRQAPGETYEYTSTWRTDASFIVGSHFCHITQVKAYTGSDTSDPLAATTLYQNGVVKTEKCSHDDSGLKAVRTFSWTPNTWTRVSNRLTTSSADGTADGAMLTSVNGDAFVGLTNLPMYRAGADQYQPKWGLYRGVDASQPFGENYMEHSAVSAVKINGQAAAPVFNPAPGAYTGPVTVAITSSTSGASIRYTTDGSAPTESNGTLYSGAFTISSTTTLRAIAYESGFVDSNVTSATYTITLPHAATPTFSPSAGTYNNDITVTISSTSSGVNFRYTTDGSTPTETSGTAYTGPFVLSGTATVRAIAYGSAFQDSAVGSATYAFVCAPVTVSPTGGTYSSAQTVTLTTATVGASIRYTLDGSTPSETSGTLYTGPVTISATSTIKAIAFKANYADSPLSSAVYTITLPALPAPTFSPAGGTFTSAQTVTISDATSGTTIHYTTDGSVPTSASPVFSSAITISKTTTLKAYATKAGFADSPVATAIYTINSVVTLNWEAESLTRTTSGASATTDTDAAASGGARVTLNATSTGSWVEFTLPNVPAGTYSLRLAYKTNNNRGKATFRVDGATVGGTLDQYASSATYPTATIATVTFASAGNHTFRLVVSGKNSASSSYTLSADKITLVGQ